MKNKTLILIILVLALIAIVTGMFFVLTVADKSDDKDKPATTEEVSPVDALLAEMTLEEKVGQMFMGCFYSGTPSVETISQYHMGGVVLFGASFENTPPEELAAKLAAIDEGSEIDPIIAVDEEGGSVVRVSASPLYRNEPFKSPRDLFAAGGIEAVVSETHEKNQLLSGLGIDMNLAPVSDISQNPSDFMYDRSIGQDVETTSTYTAEYVSACLEDGMGCCLKHFPGYGNTADTHNGIAIDNRTRQQLEEVDMLPFRAGIDAGAHAVLVSHNIVTSLDAELPASLSFSIHAILRGDMAFDGVIITDDMSMGAITQFSPNADSAVTAILAGNDMLCTGGYDTQFQAVLDAVNNGIITEHRIDESVRRILQLKMELGLI